MSLDYTSPGGSPLERLAQQQAGNHPAPCARRCEANAYEIEIRRLNAELERERMRLAACGVVALADTPESAAKAREMRNEYRSASCDDVARRVDECMTLRAERDAPRMPRNTEPCPLWQFGLIAGLVLVALGVAGAGLIYGLGLTLEAFDSYATAFLRGLVRWAQ